MIGRVKLESGHLNIMRNPALSTPSSSYRSDPMEKRLRLHFTSIRISQLVVIIECIIITWPSHYEFS